MGVSGIVAKAGAEAAPKILSAVESRLPQVAEAGGSVFNSAVSAAETALPKVEPAVEKFVVQAGAELDALLKQLGVQVSGSINYKRAYESITICIRDR